MTRHLRCVEDQEFLFGQLTAMVVNFSPVHPKGQVWAKDFMPTEMRKKLEADRPKRRTAQTIADEIRAVMRSFSKK